MLSYNGRPHGADFYERERKYLASCRYAGPSMLIPTTKWLAARNAQHEVIKGQEFKDFDVWVKAGGGQRAYIETVPVAVADGKLDIAFESVVDNPAINGIEIIPAP